jgi:hypothetical protein
MAETVSWNFELKDGFSRPAKDMSGALDHFKSGIKEAIHVFHDVIETVAYVGEALHKAFEFGEMILEQQEWKENTMIALKAITGSSEEARTIFKEARDMAIETGQSTRDMVDASKQLRQAGYAADDIRVLQVALSDLKTTHGEEAMNTVRQAMVGMANQGHLTERSLMGLKNIAGLEGNVLGFLESKLHLSEAALKKMVTAGNIPKDWGVLAIVEGIKKLGGGTLGAVTKEAAESPLRIIQSIKDEMVALFDFEPSTKGPSILKTVLLDIKDLLNPDSAFVAQIQGGISAMLEGFGVAGGTSGLHQFLVDLKEGKILGSGFASEMKEVGAAVKTLADIAIGAANALTLLGKPFSFLGKVAYGAKMNSGVELTEDAMRRQQAMGGAASVRAAAGAVGIPQMASGGDVFGPTVALIGESGPERVTPIPRTGQPSSTAGGVTQHLNLSVHVSATDANPAQVSALKDAVKDATLEVLTGAAEELAMEAGGT